MATLEEIAAKNKKLGLNQTAGTLQRIGARANKALWYAPSQIAAIPARGAKNTLEGLMFGSKNVNPLSPAFGKRLHSVGGKDGYQQISRQEFDSIKSGDKPGKAVKAKTGPMGSAYFKQKFRPGGLVGAAQKHPLLAGGAGLLAYYLATNPGARQATGAMASSMAPTLATSPTGDVQKQWSQPSYENPLASQVWGK